MPLTEDFGTYSEHGDRMRMHPPWIASWTVLSCRRLSRISLNPPSLQATAALPSNVQLSKSRSARFFNTEIVRGGTASIPGREPPSAPAMQKGSLDPYFYTSGRWLVREKSELEARRIEFDFGTLCRRVIQVCPGASSIKSYSKQEGGFDRVFVFILDNDKQVVARLPFSFAGPRSLVTNSEVATIKYLQSRTNIPIPSVIDWNDDPSNIVGSEYIIMEHATGTQLHIRWPSVEGEDKVRFMNSIAQLCREMTELEFPAYGSLYLQSGCVDISQHIPLSEGFYIGPHCGSMFWNCGIKQSRSFANSTTNRGPWQDLSAYSHGLVDAGISRLPSNDAEEEQDMPRYQGSISTHLQLLQSGRNVIQQMSKEPRVQAAALPTLFHPDIHKRNIFVTEKGPAVVTSVIDWQSTSIEPAFWHADRTPDFAHSQADDADPTSQVCAKAFEVCFQHHVPRLASPRAMDESLFRPFRYCHRTWKDGAVAFRHELMETSRCWDALGFHGPCPYPSPSPEEWASHLKEYRFFQAAQNLRVDLAHLVNAATDGWVPCDDLENAKVRQREMYDGMVQAVLEGEDTDLDDPIRTEADLLEIWPFDL